MPSGNATFTYTGEEPTMYVMGETFTKDQPQITHDNGVIDHLRTREDFIEGAPKPKLTAKQIEALDRVTDGEMKPGGSPKGGNRKKANASAS